MELPLTSSSMTNFDGAVIAATLNETANPAKMLQQTAHSLRLGGQLWLMYLVPTGGLGQSLLGGLGGLSFLDAAVVAQQLPKLNCTTALQMGAVRFERWEKWG